MEPAQTLKRRALPLLLALTANAAAQSFLFVVMPPLGRRLGFSDLQTGALLGLPAFLLLIAAPIWGSLSESYGRRPVLTVALAGAAVGTLAIGALIALRLAGQITMPFALALLFAARIGQALLAGGLLPAAQAMMADLSARERRAEAMGLLGAAYGIGAVAGGASAFAFGGTAPAGGLVGIGIVLLLCLVAFRLRMPEPAGNGTRAVRAIPRIKTARAIWPNAVATFLAVAAYGLMQQVTALRLQDAFGFSPQLATTRAGAFLMAAAICMTVAQAFGPRMLGLTPMRLMQIGGAIALVAMALVAMAPAWPLLAAGVVLLGPALGLLLPGNLATLSLSVGPDRQGEAAGLNAVSQGLAMAAAPLLGAVLHGLAPPAPAIAAAVGFLVIAALPALSCRKEALPS